MCLCEKTRDAGDGKQSIPPNVSLRNAIQEIRRAWPALSRRSPHYASIVWTTEGPKLGAGTLLARSVSGEEARILALLSVAFDCVVPSSALERLKRAEAKLTSGDIVMSAIHVALTKLPPLVRREDGYRLHLAASLLNSGILTPAELLKACELDSRVVENIAKYNPDQPRIPAGNAGGGQWTHGDYIGFISTPIDREPKSKHPKPIETAIIMPEGCEQEWKWAMDYCLDLLKKPNPPRSLTGGYSDPFLCAKGFVSERCGGNPVTGGR